ALPRVRGGAQGALLPVAARPDGAAARRSAPAPSGSPDARRRPGSLAPPRGAAGGVLDVAGAAAARRVDLADAGRRPGRDAAAVARGAQRHGPDRPGGVGPPPLRGAE